MFDGERPRRRRQERRGLSRAAFAELVGAHEIDVSRYERGEMDPPLHTLVALARVLELDQRELPKAANS